MTGKRMLLPSTFMLQREQLSRDLEQLLEAISKSNIQEIQENRVLNVGSPHLQLLGLHPRLKR
jgi:hypothetical protein